MRIQHNIMAMNAYRNYTNNTSALSKNLEKLSSGYRINRAGDDAAGLAISEKMRAQITGLQAAQKNVKDGISLVNTAEGAMQEVHDMLNRMVYLATQSANGTYDNEVDRKNLQDEVNQLREEINRIADSANFNGIKLLDGVSGQGQLTKLPVEFETVSTTAGITLDKVSDGTGTQGQYVIDISKKFSVGDKIEIKGTTQGTTAITGCNLEMGTDFSGDTIEDQAASLATTLTGKLGGYFEVKNEGSQVIITARAEGTELADGTKVGMITGIDITTTAKDLTLVAGTNKAPVTAAAATGGTPKKYQGALEVIGGPGGAGKSANVEKGDLLTFEFTDALGNKLQAQIEANAEMASDDATTATAAIVKALENATFIDNKDTTGVDESQLKVSDLFTLTANMTTDGSTATAGSIYVTSVGNADVDTGLSATGFIIDRKGAKYNYEDNEGQASVAGTTAVKAGVASVKLDSTNGAAHFTAGDKIKIEGELADGRNFEVILEAGKDFEIDKDTTQATAAKNTFANIEKALKSKG